MEQTGILSSLDKNSNYDRLFPNQDTHSGKGLGNLIALPFQKEAIENNNSCFIYPDNAPPYSDQWAFLEAIKKVKITHLDEVYDRITGNPTTKSLIEEPLNDNELEIKLSNQIIISKNQLIPELTSFFRDNLNFSGKADSAS